MRKSNAIRAVQACLDPANLKRTYQRKRRYIPAAQRPYYGHCYAGAEAAFYLLGGSKAGWQARVLRLPQGGTHWFIENTRTGDRIDPTALQFKNAPAYCDAKPIGFLTKKPSKAAQAILSCVRKRAA